MYIAIDISTKQQASDVHVCMLYVVVVSLVIARVYRTVIYLMDVKQCAQPRCRGRCIDGNYGPTSQVGVLTNLHFCTAYNIWQIIYVTSV